MVRLVNIPSGYKMSLVFENEAVCPQPAPIALS
jgi:hypothetical protein